ncbi:MAG: amino acid-binding protein [Solirubrobacteraceae bacterium]
MPRNLTVVLHDKPGELARIGETLGAAGVDVRGLAAFTGEGNGIIHLLIEDDEAERATTALHDAKIGLADDREVLVVDIHDRPGTLGEMALELAAANVNIELAYSAFGDTGLVIATDDLENARAALA